MERAGRLDPVGSTDEGLSALSRSLRGTGDPVLLVPRRPQREIHRRRGEVVHPG